MGTASLDASTKLTGALMNILNPQNAALLNSQEHTVLSNLAERLRVQRTMQQDPLNQIIPESRRPVFSTDIFSTLGMFNEGYAMVENMENELFEQHSYSSSFHCTPLLNITGQWETRSVSSSTTSINCPAWTEDAQNLMVGHEKHDKSESQPQKISGSKYKCSVCSRSFTRARTLREHFRTHNNERPFECFSCSKTFTRLKDKKRHELLHVDGNDFVCRWMFKWDRDEDETEFGCGRRFSRKDGLMAHLLSERGFRCIWGDIGGLLYHLQDRMGQTDEEEYCRELCRDEGSSCEMSFESLREVKTHFKSRLGRECAIAWFKRRYSSPRDEMNIIDVSQMG